MKKYYEILEVHPKASREVIKKAYQVLIKKYSPDLYEGKERVVVERKARDINEAYKILSDEFLREQYDIELEKDEQEERKSGRNEIHENMKRVTNKTKKQVNKRTKDINRELEEDKKTTKMKIKKGGTFSNLIDIIRPIFENIPKLKNLKNLQREDYIAAWITLAIVLVVGLILWFIPFTNSFIRNMIPF